LPNIPHLYHDISELEDFCTTTNAAESINKKKWGVPFKSACQKLHQFKVRYLTDFETHVRGDNLNTRWHSTIHHETAIRNIVVEFYELDFGAQNKQEQIINYTH